MENEDDGRTIPHTSKSTESPNPADIHPLPSGRLPADDLHCGHNNDSMLPKNAQISEEYMSSVAARIAAQPFQYSDPDVWGVLTAISEKARKRRQGMNMLLTSDEHCIGRLAKDAPFQIMSPAVSALHCKLFRRSVATGDTELPLDNCYSVFLKDSSTNGTYLNWKKMTKSSSMTKLRHGDIISIAHAPHHEDAFAFVFREVQKSSTISDGGLLKRKLEDYDIGNKRLKGIGIGASNGPISLDDFRSLQRSNTELRELLTNHTATIESLRGGNRAAAEKHEIQMRELKELVSKSYLDQLSELNQSLEAKGKELTELNRISAEQKHGIEDLTERLGASMQSCNEANEVINSQKASISELKALLDEERQQRREEREKASVDMKMAIQKVQAEAKEELTRVSESALKREKELQEMINKLQEAEKERCSVVETLRSKLENTRLKLVDSDNKFRLLEGQIQHQQQELATNRKRVEELEHERNRLRKELEHEKSAREEAWAKVSALELEISAAMRDLEFERHRLKGARERIMLRETQLRAFYSTTEEISVLFSRQQEQLKAMQRTLEDEENYTTSIGVDPNQNHSSQNQVVRDREEVHQSTSEARQGSGTFHRVMDQFESSSNETSATEKHDCNSKTQENALDTQEVECTGAEYNSKGGFGSDINGVAISPVLDGDAIGTEQILDTQGVDTSSNLEGDGNETEQVLETESLGFQSDKNVVLNKCNTSTRDKMQVNDNTGLGFQTGMDIELNKHSSSVEDTMQVDDDTVREVPEDTQEVCREISHRSLSSSPMEAQDPMEDTDGEGTIKTSDLLASEVAGSWACSTAPSVHEENDTPGTRSRNDNNKGGIPVHESSSVVAESQQVSSTNSDAATRRNQERRALSEMIGIVAPDLKEQFSRAVGSDDRVGCDRGASSNSDTEGCSDNEEIMREASDAETVGSDKAISDEEADDYDETLADSVG